MTSTLKALLAKHAQPLRLVIRADGTTEVLSG